LDEEPFCVYQPHSGEAVRSKEEESHASIH
jgi:hypothetical protein